MPSFRRAMSLRPVKTEKHETTWSNLIQNASTTQKIELISSVAGEPSIGIEVETGSTVRSIYIETNLNGVDNSGASQVFHWLIAKNPNNAIPDSAFDPLLYDQPTKSKILKRGMEMLPEIPLDSGGTVQTKRIFVVRIPPRMRRFAEADKLSLYYRSSSASNINYCGIAIFKEYK